MSIAALTSFATDMRERFDRIDQRLERLEERLQHPIVKG
jgi:hypothetical protein